MNVHTLSVAGEQYPLQDSSAREQLEGLSENLETLATKVSTNLKASVEVLRTSLTGGSWSQGKTNILISSGDFLAKPGDFFILSSYAGATVYYYGTSGAAAGNIAMSPLSNTVIHSISYDAQYARFSISFGSPGEKTCGLQVIKLNTLATS